MSPSLVEKQKTTEPRLGTARVRFKNILVATDFSEGAHEALRAAISIARYFDGQLLLLHVAAPVLYSMEVGTISPELLDVNVNAAKQRLEALVQAEPELKRIPHNEIVTSTPILDAISEAVAVHHIDLVVTGTHGSSGLEKLALGSVAESVLRYSHTPVMVVGPNAAVNRVLFRSVLLATDLEIGCLRPAQYAASVAEENNAKLTLVNVVRPSTRAPEETRALTEGRVLDKLKQLLPVDAELWCRPTLRVEFGEASEAVLNAAKTEAADLIVVGVRHKAALADHAPWATVSKIIRGAHCPVLAVPAHVS